MDNEDLDNFIETFTGKRFDFLCPTADMIDIVDIAHSLSMQCRYTGHCRHFYSIAEHCIHVAEQCSDSNKLWALLHDSSEAYLTDVASPVKPFLQNYKMMEKKIMNEICNMYKLPLSMPKEVHNADMELLRSEASMMIPSRGKDWKINQSYTTPILDIEFQYYPPDIAKEKFLNMFYHLYDERKIA